jgi:hypothetical protein
MRCLTLLGCWSRSQARFPPRPSRLCVVPATTTVRSSRRSLPQHKPEVHAMTSPVMRRILAQAAGLGHPPARAARTGSARTPSPGPGSARTHSEMKWMQWQLFPSEVSRRGNDFSGAVSRRRLDSQFDSQSCAPRPGRKASNASGGRARHSDPPSADDEMELITPGAEALPLPRLAGPGPRAPDEPA